MKLDTVFAPTSLAEIPAIARAADAMGFAGIWTAETSHDPYLPLALAGEHTERIELGTSIAVAFPRSPLVHAQIAWDPDATSSCWHGVTSVVLGNCGVAFAPVRKGQEQWLAEMMESVEDIPTASILEGLDEILTVVCLQLPKELRRSLACTNIAENMMGTVRRVTRNVKRWRDARMALRWVAAGMMEATKGFRRLKAHRQLPTLRTALQARTARLADRPIAAPTQAA